MSLCFEFQSFRDQNRKSALFNHLSTVSEAIGALGWVSVVRNIYLPHIALTQLGKKHETFINVQRSYLTRVVCFFSHQLQVPM